MSKRARGRSAGKQKQPTLFESISKTRGKAEDAGVEGASTAVVVVFDSDEDSDPVGASLVPDPNPIPS